MDRQELLLLLGVGATAVRLLGARRTGLSLRLQVFIPLAATTLLLSAAFAMIVIDRFTARASMFATRAAEDEARAIAELAARTPQDSLRPILQAFTRSAIDTDVALLDANGQVLLEAGEAHPGVARVSAEAPVAGGGRVRVRKATFGMVQLMSDVAPKVALLAFMFAVASAALAMLIGGAVAAPIERLTRAAQRVAAGERQGREVRELTHALESMRRELEERHALETFVADVSHELKNPVAAIRASAEVLTEGAADQPETARRFALRIRESADKLQQLTQDLLSLARLEARGIEPKDHPVDLCAVAREAVDAQGAGGAARGRVRAGAGGSGLAAAGAREPPGKRGAALTRRRSRRAGNQQWPGVRGAGARPRDRRRSGDPGKAVRAVRNHPAWRRRHRARPGHRARGGRAARRSRGAARDRAPGVGLRVVAAAGVAAGRGSWLTPDGARCGAPCLNGGFHGGTSPPDGCGLLRNKHTRTRSRHRRGRVAPPQPEFPDEGIGRPAGHPYAPAVDPMQVVGCAEADQVPFAVRPSLRARFDVVRVHRHPAAARDLAKVPVASADPPVQRPRPRQKVLVRLDEVLRQGDEALFGPHPALGGGAERAEGALQEDRDALRHPDVELTPRAHLLLVPLVKLPT